MIVNGWLDWAERKDGIADKIYSAPNSGRGLVCHSQEGYRNSIESRFFSTERDSAGRYTPYAAASTMFYNPLTGPLVQYYPVTASTWTSGNSFANTSLWATESEGLAGTPLNANQVENMLRLAEEWEAYSGGIASRDPAHRTVWQHNEVWNWASPNAGPTACPSNRYEPFFAALTEEDPMEPYRLALHSIAGGSFARMVQCYDVLNTAGFFAEENASDGTANPIDGQDDLNDSEVRRWRIIALAASDKAQAAYQALGGK